MDLRGARNNDLVVAVSLVGITGVVCEDGVTIEIQGREVPHDGVIEACAVVIVGCRLHVLAVHRCVGGFVRVAELDIRLAGQYRFFAIGSDKFHACRHVNFGARTNVIA